VDVQPRGRRGSLLSRDSIVCHLLLHIGGARRVAAGDSTIMRTTGMSYLSHHLEAMSVRVNAGISKYDRGRANQISYCPSTSLEVSSPSRGNVSQLNRGSSCDEVWRFTCRRTRRPWRNEVHRTLHRR